MPPHSKHHRELFAVPRERLSFSFIIQQKKGTVFRDRSLVFDPIPPIERDRAGASLGLAGHAMEVHVQPLAVDLLPDASFHTGDRDRRSGSVELLNHADIAHDS